MGGDPFCFTISTQVLAFQKSWGMSAIICLVHWANVLEHRLHGSNVKCLTSIYDVVTAQTLNSFKNRMDKFWSGEDMYSY